jgi:hypothetical protein
MYLSETSPEEILRLALSPNLEERQKAANEGGKDALAILVNDQNERVRETVAWRGYDLDKLIDDCNENVRATVAGNGYGLRKLINDEHYFVRAAVAEQGYGLEVLLNDTTGDVAACARKYISEHPDKKVDYVNPTKSSPELWEKANSDDYDDRRYAAMNGGTDILSKLVFDCSDIVRGVVASKGFGLDILIDDPSPDVRAEVAKRGYGLDTLVNDEHYVVKSAVAEMGYGLNKLINEQMGDTASVAKKMLVAQQQSCRDIAQEWLSDLTNNSMVDVIKPALEEDKIPPLVVWENFSKYNDTIPDECDNFKDYLYKNVIGYFDDDIKYHEDYLVTRLQEHIEDTHPELCNTFYGLIDTNSSHDLLVECGYKGTRLDIVSAVDRPYHINLVFNQNLSFNESLDAFMKQQGHTQSDVFAKPITNNPFIQSVRANIADMGEYSVLETASITALVSLKGENLLSTLDKLAHNEGSVVLSRDTTIGFYNEGFIKGSSFTIQLETDMVMSASSLSKVQFEDYTEPESSEIGSFDYRSSTEAPSLADSENPNAVSRACSLDPDLWECGKIEVQKEEPEKRRKKPLNMERD